MKKHIPTISIFVIIIGVIVFGVWYSDKNSPMKKLAKLDIYSKEELSFLEKEGFLDNIDLKNIDNREQAISLLKSPSLIEQNLNSPDESFEVLATKLNKDTYQLAFRLENKSNEKKDFYLIPISKNNQTEFQEIKGVINNRNLLFINKEDAKKEPLESLYDVQQHKRELTPELAQAYDDISNNNYQAKPIKITLDANTTLLAKSRWSIDNTSELEPVYMLVYGSAGGVRDELTILNVQSFPMVGGNWVVSFNTRGQGDLIVEGVDGTFFDPTYGEEPDLRFLALKCGDKEYNPVKQGNRYIYEDWSCSELGLWDDLVLTSGKHHLKFTFNDQVAYAHNAATGWTNPGTIEDDATVGTVTWSDLENAKTQGGSYAITFAVATSQTHYLKATNFGFSIPIGATIDGIVVEIEELANPTDVGSCTDNVVRLVDGDGNIVGDDKADAGAWQETDDDTYTSYGGISDLWNAGLSYTDINDLDFGVVISADITHVSGIFTLCVIDHVQIAIYYTEVTNSAPTITSVMDYPDPEEVGNDVTFSVDWNDTDAEGIKMLVCKTDSITAATPVCDGGEWCSDKDDYDSTDPITCIYTTQAGDIGFDDYYIFVCDDEPECSSSTSGAFTVQSVSIPIMIIK